MAVQGEPDVAVLLRGDQLIALKSWKGTFLSSDPQGNLSWVPKIDVYGMERFRTLAVDENKLTFQASHGDFLNVNKGTIAANQGGDGTPFSLEPNGTGKFALRSGSGTFLSVQDDGTIVPSASQAGEHEFFDVIVVHSNVSAHDRLYELIREQNLDEISALLSQGIIDVAYSSGRSDTGSLLEVAANLKNLQMVKLLAEYAASSNQGSANMLVTISVRNGDIDLFNYAVDVLGLPPNEVTSDPIRPTALTIAVDKAGRLMNEREVRFGMIDAILSKNPVLTQHVLHWNCCLEFDMTDPLTRVLEYAVRSKQQGNLDLVDAMDIALQKAHPGTINFLINQTIVSWTQDELKQVHEIAARYGDAKIESRALQMMTSGAYCQKVEGIRETLVRTQGISSQLEQMMADEEEADGSSVIYEAGKRVVKRCLAEFKPFSDDMLLAVFNYSRKKHPQEWYEVCQWIDAAVQSCLDRDLPKNSVKFVWFEKFVVPSTIWFEEKFSLEEQKQGDEEERNSTYRKYLLGKLDSQMPIYPSLTEDELNLIARKVGDASRMLTANQKRVARQDQIPNGLEAVDDPILGRVVESLFEKSGVEKPTDHHSVPMTLFTNNEVLNQDVHRMVDDFDREVHLARMCSVAQGINGEFALEMKSMMARNELLRRGRLKTAPVKGKERAKEKIGMNYHDSEFYPKSARITDLVRCSVTFETVVEMMDGFDEIVADIMRNKDTASEFGQIVDIARLKNGFVEENAGEYQDIKLNVLFRSGRINVSMLCEIQLNLNSCLKVKKQGHRLYSIVRSAAVHDMVFGYGNFINKYLMQSARRNDEKNVCKALLYGGDPNFEMNGLNGLTIACRNGASDVVALLIPLMDDIDKEVVYLQNGLLLAAWGDHAECVRLLLEAGATHLLEVAITDSIAVNCVKTLDVLREFGHLKDDGVSS